MKKLLSLALSVIMAVTLAAPAFAEEAPLISPNPAGSSAGWDSGQTDSQEREELAARLGIPFETEDFWLYDETWEWIAAHEEETRQFLSEGIDSQVQERGFDSLEELSEYWDWDQDSTVLLLLEDWVSERLAQEELEQFEAGHPGMLEQFRANAYDFFAQEYPYYGSPERYMEIWDLTEEEFIRWMVERQISVQLALEAQQRYADQMKTELGGVPGQLGVMVDGAYISFPDAAPELVNGRTMVPAQALLEALGGEAVLNGNRIECTREGIRVTFTLDSTQAEVEAGGESALLEMDCAPYRKDGCAYIPLRFIGDALGCPVGWDEAFMTAVVIDAPALAGQIDQKFTILNHVLAVSARPREEGMSLYGKAEGTLSLTLFDTLHEDIVCDIALTEEVLLSDEAVNIGLSLIPSEDSINRLLEELPDTEPGELLMLQALLRAVGKMDLIATREGKSWFHSPVLDEISGETDVWFALDTEQELLQTIFSGTSGTTIGQLALESVSFPSVFSWGELLEEAEELAATVGDDCFVTADGQSVLTIDLDTMGLGDETDPWNNPFQEFSITLTVEEEGPVTLSCCVESSSYYAEPATRIVISCTLSSDRQSIEMEYHTANAFKMELSLNAWQELSDRQPLAAPPEGAVIIDADMPTPL